jgi:hypothetical protein
MIAGRFHYRQHHLRGVHDVIRPLVLPPLGPVTSAVLFFELGEPPIAPQSADWPAELDILRRSRLQGVALHAADHYGWKLDSGDRRILMNSVFDWSVASAQVLHNSVDAIETLSGNGVPFVVTKGPGIAELCGGIVLRPFSDLDILVPDVALEEATALLSGLHYEPEARNIPPRGYFQRRCLEAINLRSPRGGAIDLHHVVPPWYWGHVLDSERLLPAAQTKRVFDSISLPLASPVHNLLVSALHLVSDRNSPGKTLMAWRDVALLARYCAPDDVAREAEMLGLSAWLRWILLSLPCGARPEPLIAALPATSRLSGTTRLRVLTSPRPAAGNFIVQVAFRLPIKNLLFFLAGVILPSHAFMRAKFPGSRHPYLLWWRRKSPTPMI